MKTKKNNVFILICEQRKIPKPETEYRFHPKRKWRFDYCWPENKLALEVEGGVWTGGRHTRGSGFVKDIEKYNSACELGYRVIRCVPTDLLKEKTFELIKNCLK